MVEYQDLTIFVRQVANGAMAISALFVIGVFLHFVWNNWSYRRHHVAVKAAIAILVLSCGHVIRSFSSWMEFLWVDIGWDIGLWLVQSWTWFTFAAILVLIGKSLMLLNFSPWRYRKRITFWALFTALTIPLAV